MIITGRIVAGGDTTPKGLLDAPRRFVYQVEKDDGSVVNLAYTAFPPSPVADRQASKIKLAFHQGKISAGQYVKARGSYDSEKNTLTVSRESDFIETAEKKYQ
jgi:hypothetical protein